MFARSLLPIDLFILSLIEEILEVIAEEHQHHLDWKNSYNSLGISLTSDDAGGITDKGLKTVWAIEEVV